MTEIEAGRRVIVAGAGPTGLWLAAELALNDVPVLVLEAAPRRGTRSKALTIHPRTVEVLASRDAHRPFLDEGVRIPTGHFGALESRLDFSVLDTPFPFTLALPQVRTEELLEARAVALGAEIRRGARVSGFAQDGDGVVVHVDGSADERGSHLVGCDGAGSAVRAAAGIDFPGTDATTWGFLGDVRLDSPPREPVGTVTERGNLLVVPLGGGLHRLVGVTPEHVGTDRPGRLTEEEFRRTVERIAGHDVGMGAPVWLSRFGDATRQAARYRLGRVLLAGDAAHVHFPAGGVGLNLGVQDAANLGWKLAAVVRGEAPDVLLDTYHDERHPVGAAVLRSSLAQTALITSFSAQGRALRDVLSTLVVTRPEVSRDLAEQLSALGVAYRAPDDAHPLVGTRAPDLPVGGSGLFALLRPGRHVLLDFAGNAELPVPARTLVHSARAPRDRLEWDGVAAALIRPDGHVASISASR
ncbi:FAD-dependent monooxygenase [Umezawaea beigongshangensis]|uniref:FAD-dependent monooxygenase n=1 Tax=Umezawaea beigongshangensis TaxID=2780383 RepID=UPI0018F23E69|nr:FAD-dependent monooxygenase [Umezawaea beigongshangensis]